MSQDPQVSIVALRTLPMFEMLDDTRLAAIVQVASLRSIKRHTTVLSAGDKTDNLYLILSGALTVMVSDGEGREVILSKLGPGEFFGEMGVIDDHPRSATVKASEQSNLVVISKADFQSCLEDNFDVSLYIMRSLVKRLRMANRTIESLALLDVYGRAARLLLDLAVDQGGRKVVAQRISRQDMARMIGASREMVSRVMRDLQLQGLIEEKDGCIWLHEGITGT